MDSSKSKWFFGFSIIVGIILIIAGLLLFIPRTTRSDTPDMYYYNIYILRYLLPIAGILLIIIGSSVYSTYKSMKEEINKLQESYRSLEKKSLSNVTLFNNRNDKEYLETFLLIDLKKDLRSIRKSFLLYVLAAIISPNLIHSHSPWSILSLISLRNHRNKARTFPCIERVK